MIIKKFQGKTKEEAIEKAKAEFQEAMKGSEYICPMTDDIPMPF